MPILLHCRSSQYYKVDLYAPDADGELTLLSPYEIKVQFEKIVEDAASKNSDLYDPIFDGKLPIQ